MAPLEPRASSASSGASGVAGDDLDRRRRALLRPPEFSCARDCVGVHGEDGGGVICATGSVLSTMECSDTSSSD